ncbi:MAG: exodeoxyribonuclease VII large subunit [Saprospiraceae bacterium]|nr:exodeoxyribonuclease VII large subunit [Saprospiraceae bacterium]
MTQNQSVSLFQLQEYIRRVLALNLPDAIWVEAEIAEINESRGHRYLSLVQKDAGGAEPVATGNAVIWQTAWPGIRRKLGPELTRSILQEGIQVRLKARVDYHERYGLKLVIEDIDPAFTFGQLEMQRRQVLERLQQEGLLERNHALPLRPVLQRIAVISSEQGAGYQDFVKHLEQNPYGYRYRCRLFSAAVQGVKTEAEIVRRLEQIARQPRFDCTVIIRGGGARLDLSAFDEYNICKAVAAHPLPVLTGIGHDIDETLTDRCAHSALKTPTAVADFLIRHQLEFESALVQLGQFVQSAGRDMLHEHAQALEQLRYAAAQNTRQIALRKTHSLELLQRDARRQFRFAVQQAGQHLDQLDQSGRQLHPQATLQRGYTLTLKNGAVLRSATEAQPGDEIETHFHDGSVVSGVR